MQRVSPMTHHAVSPTLLHAGLCGALVLSVAQLSVRIAFHDPLRWVGRFLTKLYTTWIGAVRPFASFGAGVSIHRSCVLQNPRQIAIGDFVTLHPDVWLCAHESAGKASSPSLIIDGSSLIGRRSHIFAKNRIHIEADVISAASVLIQDHGPAFDDPSIPIRYQGASEGGMIRIGRGTWIGQGAAVVCEEGELTLGANCVVAANSVVTRSAPANSLLSGNPARIVKQFDPTRGVWVLGSRSAAKTV